MILKDGKTGVKVKKASLYDENESNMEMSQEDDDIEEDFKKNRKLMNAIYFEGNYFFYEARNKKANKSNVIDNHLWLITKFMPDVSFSFISVLEIN